MIYYMHAMQKLLNYAAVITIDYVVALFMQQYYLQLQHYLHIYSSIANYICTAVAMHLYSCGNNINFANYLTKAACNSMKLPV